MFFFGETDTGRKRAVNQDSFFCENLNGVAFLTVCDGMGGANGGSIASAAAGTVFCGAVTESMTAGIRKKLDARGMAAHAAPIANVLSAAAERANTEVYRRAQADPALSGMGTTLVAALVSETAVFGINAGDSRLYELKNGRAEQKSHDHSYVQELVDLGKLTPEEAATHPHKNIITKAVGVSETVDADTFSFALDRTAETYILLCSDGLTNFVSEEEICRIVFGDLPENAGIDPQDGLAVLQHKVDSLITAANDHGGGDNITAILAWLPAEDTAP